MLPLTHWISWSGYFLFSEKRNDSDSLTSVGLHHEMSRSCARGISQWYISPPLHIRVYDSFFVSPKRIISFYSYMLTFAFALKSI